MHYTFIIYYAKPEAINIQCVFTYCWNTATT